MSLFPRLLAPARHKAVVHAVRSITTSAAQQKFQERVKLGINTPYLEDKPEKLRNIARLRVLNRPAHLIEATAKVKEFTKSAKFQEGWEFFTSTLDADIPLCNSMLHLCAKAAWLDHARSVWEKMPRESRDVVSYCTMINVCARCQQPEQAEAVFLELKESGVQLDIITYNSMINVFGMSGQPDRAVEFFTAIPAELFREASVANKQVAYQSVMIACARDGDYEKTREWFIRMTGDGVPPNHAHCNALMTACAEGAQAELAKAVFDMMPQYGLTPNVANWTILLSCHRHDLPRCKEIVQEMELATIQPSSLTYLELLQAHVLAKDGPGARALMSDLDAMGQFQHGRKLERLSRQVQSLPIS
ncbi:unnamed protein product [Polarella glacialis]|uniref:PROP1-like PPR domain-containing protein n=1 Tax=Polarella glacialis TaxID=89957 RepID=A0A813JR33_POLGL|nr:unnamed protein product [Polarella glacialis]